jgi:hypothetical protein
VARARSRARRPQGYDCPVAKLLRPWAGSRAATRRAAVLVIGMHRSGTSAMTRVLNLMGGALPRKLKRGSGANEPGFWEGRSIVRAHEAMLESLGSSWDDVRELPVGWLELESTRAHEDALLELLRADFAEAPIFVVKDPRVSRLVPLWVRLLGRFEAEPTFVIMVRHPLEVARSLASRSGFDDEKSLRLWLIHEVEAERYSRGFPRVFVTYDRLLNEPAAVVARVRDVLGVEWPPAVDEDEIRSFLSDEYRHHVEEANIAGNGTDLRDRVGEAYELACRAADDESFDRDGSAAAAFDELGRRIRASYPGVASSS